ncbi:MAG: hypothetical protein JWP89_1401 [Schlesneria sp.]|nr:hypothetical protein [Schlesneria sp.]
MPANDVIRVLTQRGSLKIAGLSKSLCQRRHGHVEDSESLAPRGRGHI